MTKFAEFVKTHYDKVRDMPANERMKKLAEMYHSAGGTKPEGRRAASKTHSAAKPKGRRAASKPKTAKGGKVVMDMAEPMSPASDVVEGAGLLTNAFGALGLPPPLAMLGLGMGLPEKKVRTQRVRGGALVPPSVPLNRASTTLTGVPMGILSPQEREVMAARLPEGSITQGPGMIMPSSNTMRTGNAAKFGDGGFLGIDSFFDALRPQGSGLPRAKGKGKGKAKGKGGFLGLHISIPKPGSGVDMFGDPIDPSLGVENILGKGLTLKEMLHKHGLKMPVGMRDKKPGTKISKAQFQKLRAHISKRKGGSFFDDFLGGFQKGFQMPFDALGAIL